jgi:hypothetical protein
LPESLDETYERILREIKKPSQEHALRLLQCLVVAVRPLKVRELAEVLLFDFSEEEIPKPHLDWRWEDEEEAIMSACSNLVTIVKDEKIVQFSHFSVKEFLTAKRLAEPIRDVSRYHIRLDAAHTILVRACLGTLLQSRRSYRETMQDFPLFVYAARYWGTHARFENVSSRIKEGLICLFDADQPHFGRWLYRSDLCIRIQWDEKPRVAPLYVAAKLGIHDAAEHIIAEHPEQMNAINSIDETSMHVAAEVGHAGILTLLLKHGTDVDVRDMRQQTPLHRASREARLEAGQFLLDHGADINAQGFHKTTPLHIAVRHGHVEFARMLLERGAEIKSRDLSRRTPLHVAALMGKIQAVRLLLEYGADVNARHEQGETPSELASRYGRQEVEELLSKYGAEPVK